jgi:hypothetical protein
MPTAEAPPPTRDDRRCLIVGAATGYRPAQLHPFVASLRAVGYRGDVVMMVRFWQFALKSYLHRNGVRPLAVWSTRKLNGPIATHRYQVCARLARKNRDRYDAMMVTDTRDVIFQKHPFAGLASPACHYFLEHPTLTIGEEPTNLRWARQFVPGDAAELAKHRISCCGIVIGGMAAMTAYLERMAADLKRVPLRLRRLGAADTPMHQRIVFLRHDTPGIVVENNVHVATVGLEPASDYAVGADGLIRTVGGHLPAVVHQYDRVPHLKAAVETRYAA